MAYGNLIFIAGVGYHQEGDIKVHTEHVPDSIKRQLESVGSSMEKVLKCNVYLNDLKDYDGMNAVFQGKFGDEPPVRTTIAAAGGIPGNSLVEIDVIALPVRMARSRHAQCYWNGAFRDTVTYCYTQQHAEAIGYGSRRLRPL